MNCQLRFTELETNCIIFLSIIKGNVFHFHFSCCKEKKNTLEKPLNILIISSICKIRHLTFILFDLECNFYTFTNDSNRVSFIFISLSLVRMLLEWLFKMFIMIQFSSLMWLRCILIQFSTHLTEVCLFQHANQKLIEFINLWYEKKKII